MPAKPPPLNGAVDLAARRNAQNVPQPVTIIFDDPSGQKLAFPVVIVQGFSDEGVTQIKNALRSVVEEAVEAALKKCGVVQEPAQTA